MQRGPKSGQDELADLDGLTLRGDDGKSPCLSFSWIENLEPGLRMSDDLNHNSIPIKLKSIKDHFLKLYLVIYSKLLTTHLKKEMT